MDNKYGARQRDFSADLRTVHQMLHRVEAIYIYIYTIIVGVHICTPSNCAIELRLVD